MSFELACTAASDGATFRIYWWGDEQPGPDELASARFTGLPGRLIVPLDAFPRWLVLNRMLGIRIDLENAASCQGMTIRDATLNQRNSVINQGGNL